MEQPYQSFEQLERESWARVAGKYDNVWSSLTRKFISPLLDILDVKKGMRLLDVACGPGYVAAEAAERGAQAAGIDFSKEMISIARKKYPQIDFTEGDAQALPFGNESFSYAAMNFGLLHIPDPDRALKEIYRILASNGRLGFTIWADAEGFSITQDAVKKFGNVNVSLPEEPPYYLFGEKKDAEKTLVAAGFDGSTVYFETHKVRWHVPSDTFIFEAELNAGVRSAAVLVQQEPQQLEAIRREVKISMEKYRVESGYEVPYAAHIIVATKK